MFSHIVHQAAFSLPATRTLPTHGRVQSLFLVGINNLLHFVQAAHEDSRSVMNVLRLDLEHALHLAVDRVPASCSVVSTRPF